MNTLEIITSYDVAVEAEQSAFADLRDVAQYWSSKQHFNDSLFEGENEYMERFHQENPDAKKKNGSWKYATYLPKAYQSSKSVLGNALDAGIRIDDKGKTQIEKELKALKNSDGEKVDVSAEHSSGVGTTTDDRARSYVNKLTNCWGDVSSDVRNELLDKIRHLEDMN